MKFSFLKKGNKNKNYFSCVFYFNTNEDKHTRYDPQTKTFDIMFKHTDIAAIIKQHLIAEPKEKREMLKQMFEQAIEDGIQEQERFNKTFRITNDNLDFED